MSIVVPQGTTPGATLVDTLPAGLALVSVDSVTASPSVTTSVAGGFAGVASGAVVGSGGGSLSLDFGTLTNSDNNSATTETVVVTYTAVVLNAAGNQTGASLTNSAKVTVNGGSQTTSAPALTVVAPALNVTETASAPKGDVGGPPLTFTVVVAHTGASTADAFDVALSDLVPAGFTPVPGSFTNTAGAVPTSLSQSGGNLAATFAAFPLGSTSTFTFQANLNTTTSPGQTVTNPAGITYTTLPGVVTTPQSAYNPVSTERTGSSGDPGGAVNTLVANASASVTVNSNTVAGFVYADANNDGVKQGGEAGVSGVTVNLGGTDTAPE